MMRIPLPQSLAQNTPAASERAELTSRERESLARDLATSLEGQVRFGLHDRLLYATDASLYQVEPLGVVIPASIEDAVRAVEFCASRDLPILPRGGGTSLAGQCTNRAVVIDFSAHCRAVIEIDAAGRRARVEPGVTIDELNEQLAPHGLFFAPDPATSRHANIGGCIGNNAAGARSILYGRTSESVLAIDAVLASGARVRFDGGAAARDARTAAITAGVVDIVRRHSAHIRERFPKTIRRNAGYGLDMILRQLDEVPVGSSAAAELELLKSLNLAPLLCGSEGTLALTLGAELRLHPLPKAKGLAVLSFSSLDAAIAAVQPILATHPSAVELLDDTVIDLARANAEYRRYVDLLPAPTEGPLKAALYVEYFAHVSPSELPGKFDELRCILPGIAFAAHTDAGAMLSAWKLRKAGEPLLHGVAGARKPITFIEDNAIPVENLARFVHGCRAIVDAHGTRAAYWAHASVGVLHVRPLLDPHDEADRARMRSIAVQVADLARSLGGVMSGEHGDGRVRTPLLERFYGRELMGAFREVKRLFDPRNLLNPGNIVDLTGDNPRPVESITERLRVMPDPGAPQRHLPIPDPGTFFDYTDQHGFDGAVEMCNGAGVCRKKQGGTMCPSYMATLDERHSTRGRGNALRLAITGQSVAPDGADARWSDPETIATLDLCLSCKACKTECPSNVDIARLKAEYTAQRFRARGVPLAARIFGAVRTLNRLGSITPDLANAAGASALGRWVMERLLKIDPRRSLPPFARSLESRWQAGLPGRGEPTVVLFGDCFTMYNEPHVGLAARRVLEAFGYRVVLANAGCCGRAKISTGLLPEAIDEIDATLERMAPMIDDPDVHAIVFAEPSCLSAVKDDWLALKLHAPIETRRRLAAKSFLPEQFLDTRWNTHPRRPQFHAPSHDVIFHGHCHQKALWGAESSAAMLKRVCGSRLRVLDSGCCGMAGSFGFQESRFDLSMQIGDLVLLPAVRSAPESATLVATGTSCRHQIYDGASRAACHPIELLDSLLA